MVLISGIIVCQTGYTLEILEIVTGITTMDGITPDPLNALSNGHPTLGIVDSSLFPTIRQGANTSLGADLSYSNWDTKPPVAEGSKAVRGLRLSTRGTRQRLIGNAGNDVLDASRGAGKNYLKGNGGNDRLLAGRSDRLFGDAGNDSLDARRGRGGNILSGGAGNDTIYAKTRDTVDGSTGDDILWAGAGSNNLRGGAGRDRFFIADRALPTSFNTIRDFQVGIDSISVNALPGVTQFSDLTLTQQGADTLISVQGRAIALLTGITASSLSGQQLGGGGSGGSTISVSNVSVSERDAGTTTVAVDVTLSATHTTPVTVSYQTVAGTAAANTDFTPTSGTLTFAPGETTKAIAVNVINDTLDEFDETFSVVLSNPINGTLGNSQAQIIILDNDSSVITASATQSDGSKTNNIDAGYDFFLYDITPNGNYRRDEDGNATNNVGIYSGAIENFTGYLREVGIDPFLRFNRLGIGAEADAFDDLVISQALTLDLRAQYIPRGGTITLPDGTTEIAPINRVEYRLTNNRLRDEAGIFEWTLILSTGLFEESVIDPISAVNSIEYIIANQLLAKADQIRFSVTSTTNPQELFVVNDAININPNGIGSGTPPPRVVSRTTPPDIPRPMPYNNAIAPINDTIATATDTGLSSSGFRRFILNTAVGVVPTDFSDPGQSRDVDIYRVQLNSGEALSIDIDGDFPQLNSYIRVFDANGTQVAFNDNGTAPGELAGNDSYLEFQPTTTGVYYVAVSGAGNSTYNSQVANSGALGDAGEYTLEMIIRESNGTIRTALDVELAESFGFFSTATRIGDLITFTPGIDVDLYRVQLTAGDTLTMDIDTTGFPAGQGVDSVLRLFNASGTPLRFSNDGAAPGEALSTDSYISHTVTASGVYYIGVSGFGNSSYDPLTGGNVANGDFGTYILVLTRNA
ncbi:MAG: pre-peptidase C-terminal domain-containing protein [Oculatellaceae cyanobacterium bins.114]|nr:pre-peptidase C-terminal domain-containing protein [Oculatellaceae cyanobacterium bins.114]